MLFILITALTSHVQLSQYDWQFETEPQENACLSMVGQVKIYIFLNIIPPFVAV